MEKVTFPFVMGEFSEEGARYALSGREMFLWKRFLLTYQTAKKWADFCPSDLTNDILTKAKDRLDIFEKNHSLTYKPKPSCKEVSVLNYIDPIDFPTPLDMPSYDE